MFKFKYLIILTSFFVFVSAETNKTNMEYYPEKWASIDAKPIVNNDRLFKKYKACLIEKLPVGCPRDIRQMRS